MQISATAFGQRIREKVNQNHSIGIKEATPKIIYAATAATVLDILKEKRHKFNKAAREAKAKKVYYLCMEFLIGKSLKNNLFNLGLESAAREALKGFGFSLDEVYKEESDAGLGNGGLGRLAACFMDALSTGGYPAMGFSIRYEYGLFKQKIVDNVQAELPDVWLDSGNVWMSPRSEKAVEVRMGGTVREEWTDGKLKIVRENESVIEAMPFDMMMSGYGGDAVSVLRLWQSSAPRTFDMQSFSQGRYMEATRYDNEAELISKVLYPADDQYAGKQLRLSQQYFLVSASLQSILSDFMRDNQTLDELPNKVAIHINDTHPALAIPELMRILLDVYGFPWEKAWDITVNTVAYTNHTVLSEALEKWNEELFRSRLPRIYNIIKEIDARFKWEHGTYSEQTLARLVVLHSGLVHMANLSVLGSHSINGVSELHSDIIKKSVFKDYYAMFPERFTNVTNGIAHRRWLGQANPKLTELVNGLVGDVMSDASKLKGLTKYKNDKRVLAELAAIKRQNKQRFADFCLKNKGYAPDPEMRFDGQVKRLHEYKRQLLNVLKIIKLYLDIKDGVEVSPQAFVFGAKAAGSYSHAKRIIQLINCLADEIQSDPAVKQKLCVFFVENYNVTSAEILIPAMEISEQISLAGKEASGTGNMKFMINGALTLGTVDGANVEILENVGEENIFIFGLRADEVEASWNGYSPLKLYTENADIRRVIDALKRGFAGVSFQDIADYLTIANYHADPYMCLIDFQSYLNAAAAADGVYRDTAAWNKKSLLNIANAGVFSADRSIGEYAKHIWNIKRVTL